MIPIRLSDIRSALLWAQLDPKNYDMWFTGKGHVVKFSSYLDSHLFTIGMVHVLGGANATAKAYKDFEVVRNLEGGGVTIVLRGSIVGV